MIDLLEIWAREKGESVAADILSDSECGSLTQDDTGFAFKILVRFSQNNENKFTKATI